MKFLIFVETVKKYKIYLIIILCDYIFRKIMIAARPISFFNWNNGQPSYEFDTNSRFASFGNVSSSGARCL